MSKTRLMLRRIVSVLTVVCMMLVATVPLLPVTASAAAPTSYTNITAGSSASVSITSSGGVKYFRFIPTQSGEYEFYSSNYSSDPKASLLDASGSTLVTGDDSGSDRNFRITYSCTANTTYYVKAYLYGSSATGSYTLNVRPTTTTIEIEHAEGISYVIFASGCTGNGSYYSSSSNYNERSIDNGGYDLYSRYSDSSMRNITLGCSFTIGCTVDEIAELAVNAYDIDESSGEKDRIYLVDETSGTQTALGLLSGMDGSWNNTTFRIDPSMFTTGHTYHFELTHEESGWVSWVRNVTLTVNGTGGPGAETGIESASAVAQISSSGRVTVDVTSKGHTADDYDLEVKATCITVEPEAQHGQLFTTVSVLTTQRVNSYTLSLESGSPEGTYRIDVYFKDPDDGSVAKTATTVASYGYSAVAYHPNGGSNNFPIDGTAYSGGDTVAVLFDLIPSRSGYTFLGWATSSSATQPQYTANGTRTFTIGSEDVVLYAVWAEAHEHSYVTVETVATCTDAGESYRVCSCGEILDYVYTPALGHDYVSAVTREATCTENGVLTYTCTVCGDSYELSIHAEHDYDVTVIEPTCTVDGMTVYRCSKCDDVITQTIPAAHTYVAEVTKQATRTEDGEITYTCEVCGHSYTEVIPASDANVLVIQDRIPWTVNSIPVLLDKMVTDGYIDGWTMTTISGIGGYDLSEFDVILIANDQTTAVYDRLQGLDNVLSEFVNAGGTLIYGACDHGWGSGDISYDIFGQIQKTDYYSKRNYIVDSTHPIITGALTDDKAITNDLLLGTYCSHSGFITGTLPAGYNIILQDAQGNATLVEYPMGDGYVILSGMTWEFYYSRIYTGSTSYSMNAFDDLIAYAADRTPPCVHKFDAGTVIDPTCTTDGYTLHTCSECGREYKDCFVPALAHEMGEWIVDRSPDCAVPGSRHQTCARCGEAITEVIPALQHTYGPWTVTKEPSVTEFGEQQKVCSGCGHTVTDTVEKLDPVPQLTVSQGSGCAGSTVSVPITLVDNPGIWGMDVKVSYDRTQLTLGEVVNGTVFTNGEWTPGDLTADQYILSYESGDFSNVTGNGVLATLVFTVNETATVGQTVAVTVSYDLGDIIDIDFEDIQPVIHAGSVTVVEHTPSEGHDSDGTGHWRTCTECSEVLEKQAHTGGEATCTALASCVVCGAAYGELAPHVYDQAVKSANTLKSDATCENDAVYYYSCVCGRVSTTDTFADPGTALGHSYGYWTVTKEPTLTQSGEKLRVCSECLVVQIVTIQPGILPKVTVSTETGRIGDAVTVDILLERNPGIWGMDLTLSYDKSQLTLVGVTNGTVFADGEWTPGDLTADDYILSFEADGLENVTADGVLVTLQFRISETATVDALTGITLMYGEGDLIDCDARELDAVVVSGGVNVIDFLYGDLNGDGQVNKKDSLLMQMYLADVSKVIDCRAADVFYDGIINKKDSLLLKQYLAGLGVDLGP